MKVLVTGASGFIGSHTVAALAAAGHAVRASARSADRVRRALRPHGCGDAVDVVEADVCDRAGVRAALEGCEAVVHAAAVFSFDARRGEEMATTNVRGAEVVLGSASELGLDPVVHVSSYVALLPASGMLTPDSPVGRGQPAYARSKAQAEKVARGLQADGAPVTIVYPGAVWGPDDPAGGESTQLARDVLAGKVPFAPRGSLPVVDVRDVAAVTAAAVARAGGGRYLASSGSLSMLEILRTVAELGGARPPRATMPAPLTLAFARLAGMAARMVRSRPPIDYEAAWTVAHSVPIDASHTVGELGVGFRPGPESLADSVRWLQEMDGAGRRSHAA